MWIYPDYYRFSLKNIIFHEAFHSTQDSSGLRYSLNPGSYESAAIDATNSFMRQHFNEPLRANHDDIIRLR